MQWFRFYHEARTDEKLATLSDAQYRVWVSLLCFASEQKGGERGTVPAENRELLALRVARRDRALLDETIGALVALAIVADDGARVRFLNWNKRQFQSDSSAPRVAAHRARRRESNGDVTLQKRDVTPEKRPVTPPEAETDTETEQKQRQSSARALVSAPSSSWHPKDFREAVASFCDEYPKPGEREATAAALAAACPAPEDYARVREGLAAWKLSERWLEDYPRYVPQATKFLAERQFERPPQQARARASPAASPAVNGSGPVPLRRRSVTAQEMLDDVKRRDNAKRAAPAG